jgi:hypothetical protein
MEINKQKLQDVQRNSKPTKTNKTAEPFPIMFFLVFSNT